MNEDKLEGARQRFLDGDVAGAIQVLKELEQASSDDHFGLQHIAELCLQCGQHEMAARCYERSVQLQPSNPAYLFNLAASKTAMGDLEEAEKLYTRVIGIDPEDHGAWQNRSALRTQATDSNHVDQLRFVKENLAEEHPGQATLGFALAKELEDLGRHEESFACLQEGAHRRRLGMGYDISEDESAMALIADQFGAGTFSHPPAGHDSKQAIFILGLPRSGTTLVDRIINAHSRVGSLGEHNTLALALLKLTGQAGNKRELIERSRKIDFNELGRNYCTAIRGFGNHSDRLVDKTPQNFLYLGLIHLALPHAKIIHLRRHPMDVCYAIYKTLFRAGYPFSYSLREVGRYYIAYHRLMDHWRKVLPGVFLDVDYESLVARQEGETRRILGYLDLEWEDNCLDFHRQSGPAATASAVQVRQPIYSSSVGLWRKYSKQLTPFANKLREHGIAVDASYC